MLSGFNTNYRHRGVVFHVQTEDSGRQNPHVITHLFHGGNIIASEKVDYSAKLDAEELEGEVKALMERQHKKMLKSLSRGECDDVIQQRMGDHVFGDHVDTADTVPPHTEEPATVIDTPPPVDEAQPLDEAQPFDEAQPLPPPAGVHDDTTKERISRAFGEGVVSEKPLDEVVLDYLVENARKRKRSGK